MRRGPFTVMDSTPDAAGRFPVGGPGGWVRMDLDAIKRLIADGHTVTAGFEVSAQVPASSRR